MTEQKAKIIKGRVILALYDELGRKPTPQEIERSYRAARMLYSTIVPVLFERKTQKKQVRQKEAPGV